MINILVFTESEQKKLSIDLTLAAIQSGLIPPGDTTEKTAIEVTNFMKVIIESINKK